MASAAPPKHKDTATNRPKPADSDQTFIANGPLSLHNDRITRVWRHIESEESRFASDDLPLRAARAAFVTLGALIEFRDDSKTVGLARGWAQELGLAGIALGLDLALCPFSFSSQDRGHGRYEGASIARILRHLYRLSRPRIPRLLDRRANGPYRLLSAVQGPTALVAGERPPGLRAPGQAPRFKFWGTRTLTFK